LTIVAGFKFHGGVVVCADTQETVGSIIKRQVPKLRFEPSLDRIPGQLPSKSGLAVAFCGATNNGPFVDKVIDLAWEKGKGTGDLAEACSVIEQSIKDTHQEFGSIYQTGYMPDAELIFGVKMGGQSRLFHSLGPVVNERTEYVVAGVGEVLAEFLAGRMYEEYLTAYQCVILAAYILYQSKEHVEGCGGESHIAILRNDGSSGIVENERIKTITELLKIGDFESGRMLLATADVAQGDEEFEKQMTIAVNHLKGVRGYRKEDLVHRLERWDAIEEDLSGRPVQPKDEFGLPVSQDDGVNGTSSNP
jgi:20S proteasome alpha/beta subunit